MGDLQGATGGRTTRAPPARPLPLLLTTAEAATYLRFRSSSGIRTAVMRGELHPVGAGPLRQERLRRGLADRVLWRLDIKDPVAAGSGSIPAVAAT